MLLLRLHKLALRLQFLLPWCYCLVFGGVLLALTALYVGGVAPSARLTLGLGLSLWALLLFAFIRLFQSIPPPVLPKDTFFERLKSRVKLWLYHLLALGVLVVGVALVAMSLKLLSATSR